MKQFICESRNLHKIVINPKVCEITSFCLELGWEKRKHSSVGLSGSYITDLVEKLAQRNVRFLNSVLVVETREKNHQYDNRPY